MPPISQIRVGYAGPLGEPRAQAFEAFLRARFDLVASFPLGEIRSTPKVDFDVLVVDGVYGKGHYLVDNDAQRADVVVEPISLDDVPTPTVFVGGLSGWMASESGLLLGRGGIFLRDPAVIASLDHPVFAGVAHAAEALPVVDYLQLLAKEAGDDEGAVSRIFPDPEALAYVIEVVEPFPEDPAELQARDRAPGLVTNPQFGLPDFEWICGAMQGKTRDGASVCRQGRYLSWGFADSPVDLTDAGRTMLANAIAYINTFADHEPITFAVATSRSTVPAVRQQCEPDFMGLPPEALQGLAAQSRNSLIRLLGSEDAAARLLADDWRDWWELRAPYLTWVGGPNGGCLLVDDDAVHLGLGLDDPAILERCVDDLEADDQADRDRASRLLRRLTLVDQPDAAGWRAWLDERRNELIFTQTGGYRYVWPGAPPLRPFENVEGRPPHDHVVDVRASVSDGPSGPLARLAFVVAPGHEIFVTDGTPLSIEGREGSDFQPMGMSGPTPLDGRLRGRFVIQVPLEGHGSRALLTLRYQSWSAGDVGPLRELPLPALEVDLGPPPSMNGT